MEAKALAREIRISPQKARLIVDLIRGKDVASAISTLRFMPKKGARILRKVVESALANASQNESIDVDTLYVKKIFIDGGPMLKRMMPRAQGRANRILKRTSHITVVLDEQ
jgi:large subunit ribosomal protein L22